ncbi:hypothetical protein [Dubosiella newyorkensis]|nr:hypothetical protein [Dubosiella newyorkensis]MCI9041778.1 hypothetical protein [Dubosiella newyorkensis]
MVILLFFILCILFSIVSLYFITMKNTKLTVLFLCLSFLMLMLAIANPF